jgi:hypothetical protein
MADTVKTIFQGALGAVTFGAYHQFTTNKIMELNNEKLNLEHKYNLDRMENEHKYNLDRMEKQHQKEMDELRKQFNELKQSRRWF